MDFRHFSRYIAIGISIATLIALAIDSVWSSLFVVLAFAAILVHVISWTQKKPVETTIERDYEVEDLVQNISEQAKNAMKMIDDLKADLKR